MKNKKLFVSIFLLFIIIFMASSSFAEGHTIINEETNRAIAEFSKEINIIANILIAFSLVTSVLIVIIHFVRISGTYQHSLFRYRVLMQMGTSLLCTALMGIVGVLFKVYLAIFL